MATNTPTLTVRRAANGWIVETDVDSYVATTPTQLGALIQRWATEESPAFIRYEWPGPPPYVPAGTPPPRASDGASQRPLPPRSGPTGP
jgi:hypothetical protein